MSTYQSSYTNPSSSPNVQPSSKDFGGTTDLMLVIQSVTDQSKNLGAVCAEVSQLKSGLTENSKDVKDLREKSIGVEHQLKQIDKTLTQLNSQIEKGFADLVKSMENTNAQQGALVDLKLAPISQSVSIVDLKLEPIKLTSQQISGDLKKVEVSVEELKSFRWKFGGALVVIAVIASALVTYLIRTLTSP